MKQFTFSQKQITAVFSSEEEFVWPDCTDFNELSKTCMTHNLIRIAFENVGIDEP